MAGKQKARPGSPSRAQQGKQLAPKYTDQERALLQRFQEKRAACPKGSVKVKDGNNILFDHDDQIVGQVELMESLNLSDYDFIDQLMSQLANAGSQGRDVSERGMNFMLSVIKGIEPRDQVEVMLGAQMAATHMATMTFARRLAHCDNIQQQDSAEKAFNKLMRTFTNQMEALRKYRTGGEQKVIVQHVHVNEGGQAVVGSVTHRSQSKRTERGGDAEK